MTVTTATIPFVDANHNHAIPLDAPPPALDGCTFAEIMRAPATLAAPMIDNAQVALYGDSGTTPGTVTGGVCLLAIFCPPNLPANDGELVFAHDAHPNFTGAQNAAGACFAIVWLPSGPFGDRTVEVTG